MKPTATTLDTIFRILTLRLNWPEFEAQGRRSKRFQVPPEGEEILVWLRRKEEAVG